MNLLLDTNVLIDFLGRKEPFFDAAQRVVAAGFFGDVNLWTPVQSLKDAFYVLEHYVDSHAVQQAMAKALDVISPVSLTADDALRGLQLGWDDYEDCLVALAAEKARADWLITRDETGFERSPVPVLNPEQWLMNMEASRDLSYASCEL